MSQKSLFQIVQNFSQQRMLVIGDVMIDAYCWGKVERISPEAPVPVVAVDKWDHRLGGAANVALNGVALAAEVAVCSVVGNDKEGDRCLQLFQDHQIQVAGVVRSEERPTTIKTRVIAGGHHIVRIDEEVTRGLSANEEQMLMAAIRHNLEEFAPTVIVLEDYNKGVMTPALVQQVIAWANEKGIPTTVDPKKDHFFAYQKCTLFKPNLKELREGLKREIVAASQQSVQEAIHELESKMSNAMTLLTLSEHGICMHSQEGFFHQGAHPRKVVDVSGAGDSVITVASLALAAGAEQASIATLSNLAGGLVCEKVGVVPITAEMLLSELK
jgi:rfaE bifunctional protein kinase chain/domain